jgi:hypothetical protein
VAEAADAGGVDDDVALFFVLTTDMFGLVVPADAATATPVAPKELGAAYMLQTSGLVAGSSGFGGGLQLGSRGGGGLEVGGGGLTVGLTGTIGFSVSVEGT